MTDLNRTKKKELANTETTADSWSARLPYGGVWFCLFVVTPVFPTPNNILNYNLLWKKGGGFVRDLQFLAAST